MEDQAGHDGKLAEGLGFKGLGVRVEGLVFRGRVYRFRAQGLCESSLVGSFAFAESVSSDEEGCAWLWVKPRSTIVLNLKATA